MGSIRQQYYPLQVGAKFGLLTVIGEAFRTRDNRNRPFYYAVCECECGRIVIARKVKLIGGITKSCGHRQVSNGATVNGKKSPIYRVWEGLRTRCNNPKCDSYPYYGGRGISVCDEWQDGFAVFRDWAIKNGYQEGLQIDRIDNNGNYEPGNCRFVTRSVNMNNRRVSKKNR